MSMRAHALTGSFSLFLVSTTFASFIGEVSNKKDVSQSFATTTGNTYSETSTSNQLSRTAISVGTISTTLLFFSVNSDQHQFSPDNIHTLSRDKVMRINKMIS